MTQEQIENAEKLEEIRNALWRYIDRLNRAGYEPSPYELHLIENIKQLADACGTLARQ